MDELKYIFVDMDGVICNFVELACQLLGKPEAATGFTDYNSLGLTEDEFWKSIDEFQDSGVFWENFEKFTWTDQLISAIENTGIEWRILTSPSQNPNSASGKVTWLQRHFGSTFKRYVITKHKELCAGPGRLLIDDMDHMCRKFVHHGGDAIVFPQLWNQAAKHVDDRMGHVTPLIREFAT